MSYIRAGAVHLLAGVAGFAAGANAQGGGVGRERWVGGGREGGRARQGAGEGRGRFGRPGLVCTRRPPRLRRSWTSFSRQSGSPSSRRCGASPTASWASRAPVGRTQSCATRWRRSALSSSTPSDKRVACLECAVTGVCESNAVKRRVRERVYVWACVGWCACAPCASRTSSRTPVLSTDSLVRRCALKFVFSVLI